jgi:GTP-binding protein Era
MQNILGQLATEIKIRPEQVQAAVSLLDDGATVPFIARYRKEATGGLDDIQLRELEYRLGYLREMQERHAFTEFFPMSAKQPKDVERLLGVCEKYLPEQPWWHAEDELTDRSEKFLASEMVREKLFRLTGDELPYTSTVVIDKFEEEAGRTSKRMLRIAATIVVEREGHKAMVIGDKGEKLKRIGTETRVELEKLLDAKVFIELWVKVRSGWADDEARVRSFGYE